jgi:hypothetical protein
MVLDGEPFGGKSDRRSMGRRVEAICPGNKLGQLGDIEDRLTERYDELPENGRIDPRDEVLQILARTTEFEPCKRRDNNAGVGD